jgi:N-methylhydantoinase B
VGARGGDDRGGDGRGARAHAISPNIRERRDASAALFDAAGRMVAQAAHIPVHLGAMPDAVRAVRARDPRPGDVFLLNDPYAGGSHLPTSPSSRPWPIPRTAMRSSATRRCARTTPTWAG